MKNSENALSGNNYLFILSKLNAYDNASVLLEIGVPVEHIIYISILLFINLSIIFDFLPSFCKD
jgi:hypothetical protein